MSENDQNIGNNDDNNQQITAAATTTASTKRGPYKKLERMHIGHEIERMILAGYDSAYIKEKLNLPDATYRRYRRSAFVDEKAAITGLSIDLFLERAAIFDRRLLMISELAIKIASEPSEEDKIGALGLAAEIEKARLSMYVTGPHDIAKILTSYPKLSGLPEHLKHRLADAATTTIATPE